MEKKYISLALTAASCAGVIITSIFAARDGMKANRVLNKALCEKNIDIVPIDSNEYSRVIDTKLSLKESIKCSWQCYIPTSIAATATIGTIIFNHELDAKQIASLTLAASAGVKLASDYREAIKKVHGYDDLHKIDQIVRYSEEHNIPIAELPIEDSIEFADPDTLFFDPWLNMYFSANMVGFKDACLLMNKLIQFRACATAKEFYNILGVNVEDYVDEYHIIDDLNDWGWGEEQMDAGLIPIFNVDLIPKVREDGQEYYEMSYISEPEWITADEKYTIERYPWFTVQSQRFFQCLC